MGANKIFRDDVVHYHNGPLWKQNCILCGHVSGASICDQCIGTARNYFDSLIDFLSENPKSTFMEVYGNTTIPYKIIKAFVELGWINLVLEDNATRLQAVEVMKVAHKI